MAEHVLILGGGAREHALGWKLKASPRVGQVLFAPGNAGTARVGRNVDLPFSPVTTKAADEIDWFCRQNEVGLVVIGPEDPLAEGLADRLRERGRAVFGPDAEATQLEADKGWAKQLMRGAAIPTAEARVFDHAEQALAYVRSRETPIVVKAAGLAAGKGVMVCDTAEEAERAVQQLMVARVFGEAGARVVVEERLQGEEASVLALVDGESLFVLEPAQDHKRVGEGDTGPNTGGMGAYSPTPVVEESTLRHVERDILVPAVDALRRHGLRYQGVLYAGLILTAGGPKVLEFNCRFGDPECQPLMMRLQGDLYEAMKATVEGRLVEARLGWDERPACCVVMASEGYPGKYEKGKPITGIEAAEADPDVRVFHAGTAEQSDGTVVTAGGRVLSVCALGTNLEEAQRKANEACEQIRFEGAVHRRDIGFRALRASRPQSAE
jgi:phosphoribosylamine--glycine ligase